MHKSSPTRPQPSSAASRPTSGDALAESARLPTPLPIDAMRPARVLIVEDDLRLAALLVDYLASHGFDVTLERDGEAAIDAILSSEPDVVVLDLMLPRATGFEVCRRVREPFRGAILMLTASKTESDHVTGLDLGADDFVTKPIDPRILLARVRSLVRRVGRDKDRQGPRNRIALGALVIDRELRLVKVGGVPIELTGAEFGILWLLIDNAGYPVSREAMHTKALGTRWIALDRGLDAHVSRRRRKLQSVGFNEAAIQSVRGEGYRLVRI